MAALKTKASKQRRAQPRPGLLWFWSRDQHRQEKFPVWAFDAQAQSFTGRFFHERLKLLSFLSRNGVAF